MKFLIVGFGSIGKRHFENLSQIQGVETSVLTRRQLEIPNTTVYRSSEEALNENFDAVFITNETAQHIPTALRFAEKGYNLFIEKPLSHNMENVDKLVNIVCRNNTKVMIGCNMRFHPIIQLVKGLIQKGELGDVISARIQAGHYLPDWHPSQDYRKSYSACKGKGGGVTLDLIHELDYAYWFLGQASRVFCSSGKRSNLEIDTEDVAEILIQFQNGALCEVHLDYIQRYPARKLELISMEKTLCADLITNKVEIFDAAKGDWEAIEPGNFNRNKMYMDEVKHFIDYIRGLSAEPLISLEDGVKVLQIALAAKESSLKQETILIQS